MHERGQCMYKLYKVKALIFGPQETRGFCAPTDLAAGTLRGADATGALTRFLT